MANFDKHSESLEAKQRHADAVLSAAYQRAGESQPRMNGRSFFQFVREASTQEDDEGDEEFELRMKHWGMFCAFIFGFGPAPDRACKRLYAMVWATNRKLLLGMNIREVSDILGETRAAGSNRVNTEFSDYLASWGCVGTRVNGQKREGTRQVYADLAEGNTSRKCGRKKGDGFRQWHKNKK